VKNIIIFLIAYSLFPIANAQTIDSFKTNVNYAFRGLSVPSDDVIWVSGTKGTIGRSIDAGKTWTFKSIPGMENKDLRDIHAFDANNAIALTIASPGYLLKTTDGGNTWKTIFTDADTSVFFDAMDFNNKRKGVLVGDPINNQPYLLEIDFNKEKAKRLKASFTLKEGEAFFAASGTNVQMQKQNDDDVYFVTGGRASRLGDDEGKMIDLPLIQGKESTGANSIAVWNKKKFIIAGGDFGNDKDTTNNCFYTNDGGKTFIKPSIPPHGYRSCIIFVNSFTLVACGTSGVDVSTDGGNTWKLISTTAYHTVQKAQNGNKVYLTGPRGRVASLRF
jgi:hypothetical protein